MSRLLGWDLPPGCSHRDIEDAMGDDVKAANEDKIAIQLPLIDTFPKIVAWLAEKKVRWEDSGDSPTRAALWYVAYQEAEECAEFTLKETAHMFMDGLKPTNVYYATRWVKDRREEWEEEGGNDYEMEGPYDLRSDLEDFFQERD